MPIAFSHDPEAGSLYCYFTELEAGQAVYTLEYPATLWLDASGAIHGFEVLLDDEVTLDQLDLPLQLPGVYILDGGRFQVAIDAADPYEVVQLAETAIFDLDEDDHILGCELLLPVALRQPARLARLAALMVALDDDPAEANEGPVVFQIAPDDDEAAAAAAPEPTTATPPKEAEAASSAPPPPDDELAELHTGFVALVGQPNVGKSTLLNALLGQKVAIVSPRPQTTRFPLRGILQRPDAQVIFIDTPGIHTPLHNLGKLMVDLARRTVPNADVVCFLVDISRPPSRLDRQIADLVRRVRIPRLLVLNKVDLAPQQRVISNLEAYRALGPWDMEIAVSALRHEGLDTLVAEIVRRLPTSRRLYPADQVTDQSERQLAAELVREQVLRYTEQEVPHAVAVEVEEWEEREKVLYLRMSVNVEREGQKAILIGAGGSKLKQIGRAARMEIERLLGRTIYLDLWIKVRSDWRNDPTALGWLGYRLKDWQP